MAVAEQTKPAQQAEAAQAANLPAIQREARILVQDDSSFANLLDTGRFEHMWRVARTFAASKMVPKIFQDRPEDCFVAIQMAVRLEVDPFMFMQNTYPSPDGKPAMEGKLAIALINARGPFRGGVQFRFDGEGDNYGCTAYGIHRDDGQERSLKVTLATVKAEGWYGRNKKWQNMAQQMFIYRAGAWFGRAYCPEVLMGMQTIEEAEDIGQLRQAADGSYAPSGEAPARPTRQQFLRPVETVQAEPQPETQPSTTEPQTGADAEPGVPLVNGVGEVVEENMGQFDFAIALVKLFEEAGDHKLLRTIFENNEEAIKALPEGVLNGVRSDYDKALMRVKPGTGKQAGKLV